MITKDKIHIIAEIGVNHNGSLSNAIEMIQVAKEAKADAIKFQTAVPDLVMTSYAQKADYQIQESEKKETQLDMIKKIHLPQNDYRKLKDECDKKLTESTLIVSVKSITSKGVKL